jgi:addiction module HigA family antidote
MSKLPTRRPPTHPGETLIEEFLKPLNMNVTEFSERIHASRVRLSEIVNARRGVTPDTALRFAKALGTTPEIWLNLQRSWDLWHASRSNAAREIDTIEPITGRSPAA